MESRDLVSVLRTFFPVSVSKVSGLASVSKATGLRHKPSYFEYCNDMTLEKFCIWTCLLSAISEGKKQPKQVGKRQEIRNNFKIQVVMTFS